MKAYIKIKKEVANETLRVEFEISQKVDFKPGQYMHITLINPPETDAEGASRYYSISISPLEKGILALTTRLRDTAFKRVLRNLPMGAEVEIDEIGGKFVLPDSTDKPLVFIAGGIGITPFLSMISYADQKSLDHKITLFYSNRDKESTAYFDYLDNIQKKNKNIKVVFIMTQDPSWQGENKHLNPELLKKYLANPANYKYYIAGPPQMVKAVYQEVLNAGVNSENIATENFDGY